MNRNYTSNNIQNDDLNHNNEEGEYNILITRLKEISSNLALIEKFYLDKFKNF